MNQLKYPAPVDAAIYFCKKCGGTVSIYATDFVEAEIGCTTPGCNEIKTVELSILAGGFSIGKLFQ